MSRLPSASLVRRAFLRVGIATAIFIFIVVGGSILFDQWAGGRTGGGFMLGTALVLAGACIGVFAIIVAIGLAVSTAFKDDERWP